MLEELSSPSRESNSIVRNVGLEFGKSDFFFLILKHSLIFTYRNAPRNFSGKKSEFNKNNVFNNIKSVE